MFFVSQYLQTIPYDEDTSIVWHSIFGNPTLLSNILVDILEKASSDTDVSTIINQEISDGDTTSAKAIETLESLHFLITSPEDEKEKIRMLYQKHNQTPVNKVKNLSLIMSEECQFRCKYCIHFANSRHNCTSSKLMSEKIAKQSIDHYLDTVKANGLSSGYINFGGGEPLLNWPVIKKLLDYIDQKSKELNLPIRKSINTNLGLITKEIAKTLIEHHVEIAASLDGTKKGNDSVRLDKNLGGTYDQIIKGFKLLKHLGRPLDGFAMTVNEDNFADVDAPIVDWAASHDMTEIRIDIDVVGMVRIPVNEIVDRLMAVRQYAKSKGIKVIGFWSRPVENLGLDPETEDIGFCGGERGNSLCVAPNGEVFPCGYSNYELCTHDKIPKVHLSYPYQKLLWERDITELKSCRDCPILGFCRGGCLITRESNDSDSEKINRMCELYRAMTYAILRESVAEEGQA